MVPLIIESNSATLIQQYLNQLQQTWHLIHSLTPEKNSISLDQIKELIRKTQFASSHQKSLFVVHHFETVSLPGQQALLKPLEDSPENQLIILTTANAQIILPTIISRCQIKKLEPTLPDSHKPTFKIPQNPISTTDEILKGDPQTYLNHLLQELHQNPTPQNLNITKALLTCLSDLDQNVNPKLALDHFFFSIENIPIKHSHLYP